MDSPGASRASALIAGAVLAVACVSFSFNLGGYGLWPVDEPRFGQVAREMMASGDYLAPHVNGEAYNEKPPLLFWAIAGASIPWGDVTEVSARIPSVCAALLTLFCTYLLAVRLFSRQTALWSVIILATGSRFWWQARTAQIDMLLTACLTVALLSFWLWYGDRKRGWLVLFYGAMAAGLYAKGPPALVFPLLMILFFFRGRPEDRKQTHWIVGTCGALGAALLWLVPARMAVAGPSQGGVENAIGGDLFRQIIGRFFLGVSHAQPPWYFLETLFVDWLPWSLFFPFAVLYVWKHRKDGDPYRFLLMWIVPAFVFFSISIGKRAIYLLPIFPPMAILMAEAVLSLVQSDRIRWRKRTGMVWAALLLVAAAAPWALRYTEYADGWSLSLAVFSGLAAVLFVHAVYVAWSAEGKRLHYAMAAHVLVLELAVASFVLPAVDPYKSARAFCAPMRRLSENHVEYRLYSLGFSREEYVFYSKHFHKPLLNDVMAMELPPERAGMDVVDLQVRLRKKVTKAACEVPIASFEKLTAEEFEGLSRKVNESLAKEEVEAVLVDSFRVALDRETVDLEAHAPGATPSLVMIRERDLRWLLPLLPRLQRYEVVHAASVGSRTVVLLANDAAYRLLALRKS